MVWNEYKSKIQTQEEDANNFKRSSLDSSFQGVNCLYVMAFDDTNGLNRIERNNHRRYFLPRAGIKKYNVLIDSKNFYDQPTDDQIRKYDELKGDDYTTGCLLDYNYYKNHYKVIACDLSKQKELDADPRAIQQLEFTYMLNTNAQILTVLEKNKETVLEFYKGTVKVL